MRHAWITVLALLAPQLAAAQAPLDAAQQTGRRLFTQSCAVCHLKPALTAGRFGPALYGELIAGQEPAMHGFIADGTDRMPGFKYQFDGQQIDAIIAYLKTVPKPPDADAGAPSPASRRGPVD
jgi:mono/diheme cytochrome c family protein